MYNNSIYIQTELSYHKLHIKKKKTTDKGVSSILFKI